MIDAAVSHVRMRDLARLGRARSRRSRWQSIWHQYDQQSDTTP